MSDYNVITSDFLNLSITNSNQQYYVERRFQKGITIDEFKGKLELITGGNPTTMVVEVFDKNDRLVCTLNNGQQLLGSYPIDDGMRIHVIDNFSRNEANLSNVEKFEISEEEYAKRTDTVKAFLEKNKLGKYNKEKAERKAEEKRQEEAAEEAEAKLCHVGDRCEVCVPNQPKRRATIMYVGKTEFKEGWWIGVKYDEPLGKNDGTVNGKKYFECSSKYGGFIKPMHIKVGNFPEEEFDLNEEL
nr:tubulin-folding cofactor B [Megalopta genalis]